MTKNFADMSDAEMEAFVKDLSDRYMAGVLDLTNGAQIDSEAFFNLLACFEYAPELLETYGPFYKSVYYEAARRFIAEPTEPTEPE
jgi:hypothetical protein